MTAFLGHKPKTDAAKLAAQLDSIADEELSDDFPGSASIVRQAAEMLRASIPVDVERYEKIGFLSRNKYSDPQFVQEVFSIPLPVHGTLYVYMKKRDNSGGST